MKKIAIVLVCAFATVGATCHGQVPPNPTSYTCPDSQTAPYTPLNTAKPAPAGTFTDTPGPGQWCYLGQSQSTATTPPLVSAPSNILGPQSGNISFTINAPTQGVPPTGYIISRAQATAVTILAPSVAQTVAVKAPSAAAIGGGSMVSWKNPFDKITGHPAGLYHDDEAWTSYQTSYKDSVGVAQSTLKPSEIVLSTNGLHAGLIAYFSKHMQCEVGSILTVCHPESAPQLVASVK